MYGLVNKAVEDLVCTRFGVDVWDQIRTRAGIGVDSFISMDPYPDDVTYKLVGAASEVLGLPPATVLEAFGEFWIRYTAKEGYGEMFTMFGSSLGEFLHSLDALHTHIGLSFPQLRPPTFDCEDLGDGAYLLSYFSSREGLAPMMIGLLKGLAVIFDKRVEVQHVKSRADVGHDEFHIREFTASPVEPAPESTAS